MQIRVVTDYLDISAEKYPERTAYDDGKRSLTFKELKREAYCIADQLVRRNLFKIPVAVYLDKSVACMSTFMGVAYSGNFYSPIDTSMPESRIEKILNTLAPKAIITDSKHVDKMREFYPDAFYILYDEAIEEDYNQSNVDSAKKNIIDSDILYVLFTSGSTGTPKGVIITHRSVVNYIEWAVEQFKIDDSVKIGNQAPFYFDMSVYDIYLTLKTGGTMYIIPRLFFAFPAKLLSYLKEKEINFISWASSAYIIAANLGVVEKIHVDSLKWIFFGGEVMTTKQMNIWRREYPNITLVNLYGPTEATVYCTYYPVIRDIPDTEAIPIGYPCKNTDILILTDKNEQVHGDEIGELCVRGTSLALGYYNNSEKTSAAFVQNPLNTNYPELIYRTGDLVHYNEHGEIMYDSRKDFQIKHLGHRIELGEIETAAAATEGVDQNCCLYDSDHSVIVLFYTGKIKEDDLKKELKNQVSDYMVPGQLIKLESMPLNLNGKIDRVQLKTMIGGGGID